MLEMLEAWYTFPGELLTESGASPRERQHKGERAGLLKFIRSQSPQDLCVDESQCPKIILSPPICTSFMPILRDLPCFPIASQLRLL